MLNVALTLIPAGNNDRQAVLFAQPVASSAYFLIAVLVEMAVLMVREADRIENQTVMNMSFINIG